MTGLVLRSTGSWYEVQDLEVLTIWKCRLKGKFKHLDLKVTNPVAVGDVVDVEIENEQQRTAIISAIHTRENYIARRSVHKTGHSHILAANLDQAALVVTLTFPKTSLGFIDRFLVTTESFRIPTLLVFNKQDILAPEWLDLQEDIVSLYRGIGYDCLLTDALSGAGLDALKAKLLGKKTLLSGHSGVGKSTLMNQLYPGLNLKTQQVSTYANKGVHTTTFAEMHACGEGTYIIDSPGIKELGLSGIAPEEISHFFPEMRSLLNTCRFHNCLHVEEPGCSVKQAVAEDRIGISRYESYLSMLSNQDNRR
ncbi:ribosome small subunit-dependent GTPase A [Ravibacter arvi]|uniref:Small ribosomal subunit biogenesis GTPase RsgA n=1 Tax=Ravibacter arvi TaxID=2051041 RepID=A0ABP8LRS6_9BACT